MNIFIQIIICIYIHLLFSDKKENIYFVMFLYEIMKKQEQIGTQMF